jgi:hypothetical protein
MKCCLCTFFYLYEQDHSHRVLFVALDVRQVLTGPSAEAAAALKADVLKLVHTLETLSMPAPPLPAAAAAAAVAAVRTKLTPSSTPAAATSAATSGSIMSSSAVAGSSSSSALSAQQRKVARFYATELSRLCLPTAAATADSGPLGGPLAGLAASHFHARFQDAVSSVLRFELKRLLNVCWCEHDAAAVQQQREQQQQQQQQREREQRNSSAASADDSDDDVEADVAPCSCVLVDDTTGTLQFNSEDPAALLSLALQFMHPAAPLATVLLHGTSSSSSASSSSSSSSSGSTSGSSEPDCEVQELDRVLQQCWHSEQWTPQDEDMCIAAVRARVRSLRNTSSNTTATANVTTTAGAGGSSCGADGSIGVLAAAAAAAAAAEDECLPLEDIDDLLAYTAGHCYLQYVFSQPPVLCAVAAGHWAHVSELARESSVFFDSDSSSSSSSCGLHTSLLGDVPALAQSCLQDSRAVRRLRGALVVERRLATHRVYTAVTSSSSSSSDSSSSGSGSGHNSRKRLRCRAGDSPAATSAAAAVDCSGRGTLQFPEVVSGCRLSMTEEEAAYMAGWH